MKRKRLKQLSLLSAFVLMTTIPYHITPVVEAESVVVRREDVEAHG